MLRLSEGLDLAVLREQVRMENRIKELEDRVQRLESVIGNVLEKRGRFAEPEEPDQECGERIARNYRAIQEVVRRHLRERE